MTTPAASERSPLLRPAPPSLPSPASPSTPTKSQKAAAAPVSPSALARPNSDGRNRPVRNVTFDPNPVSQTIDPPPPSSSSSSAAASASRAGRPPLAALRQRSEPSATATTPAFSSTSPLSYGTTSAVSSARSAIGASGAPSGHGGGGGGPPVLAAINSRLRRRNSYGSGPLAMQQQQPPLPLSKIGPQRSTKNAQKLKLLPNPDFGEDGPDEESGRDVYSQYTRIKDPTARRDAALLGKADRARLPRVTAYCTANRYEMDSLMRFLKGRGKTRGGNPKLIDECIYTPYDYDFGKNGGSADGTSRGHHRKSSRVRHHSYIGGGSGERRQRPSRVDEEPIQEQPQEEQQQEQQGQQQQSQQSSQSSDPRNDSLQPPSSYYQERRHSAGEVDSDHSMLRRESLIDLEGAADGHDGDSGNDGGHSSDDARRRRNEEAIADDDEILPRTARNAGGGGYGNERRNDLRDDQYYDDHQQRHRQQAAEAVMDLLSGDDLDRQAAGDDHGQLQDEFEQQLRGERPVDFDINVHTPELFLFDYGVVVIWGMSEAQEQRFLKELAKFELEKLAPDDVEAEFFNFYYTREYQARIYNDFIALRDKNNYMTKLAISHALAQSVKTSLFEELIASTIDTCKDIPTQIALTGTIALSRTQINMQIGELFILRINIHLNGSVLDTPELFWVEPQLEPVYQAVRSYLEMDQRVGLLTQRLDVIADLLAVLKEQLSHGHGEKLEWIVIVLIAAEILVAAINIVVDLYAGV